MGIHIFETIAITDFETDNKVLLCKLLFRIRPSLRHHKNKETCFYFLAKQQTNVLIQRCEL